MFGSQILFTLGAIILGMMLVNVLGLLAFPIGFAIIVLYLFAPATVSRMRISQDQNMDMGFKHGLWLLGVYFVMRIGTLLLVAFFPVLWLGGIGPMILFIAGFLYVGWSVYFNVVLPHI